MSYQKSKGSLQQNDCLWFYKRQRYTDRTGLQREIQARPTSPLTRLRLYSIH